MLSNLQKNTGILFSMKFILILLLAGCGSKSLKNNIQQKGYYVNEKNDRVSAYYIYDFVSKEEVKRHAMQSNSKEGNSIANYYFSRNGNIPSHELKLSKSLVEANNIINRYSYNVRYGFTKDSLGNIKFADCLETPQDDLCTPN